MFGHAKMISRPQFRGNVRIPRVRRNSLQVACVPFFAHRLLWVTLPFRFVLVYFRLALHSPPPAWDIEKPQCFADLALSKRHT